MCDCGFLCFFIVVFFSGSLFFICMFCFVFLKKKRKERRKERRKEEKAVEFNKEVERIWGGNGGEETVIRIYYMNFQLRKLTSNCLQYLQYSLKTIVLASFMST